MSNTLNVGTMSQAPSEVYPRQLLPPKYGYPLFIPAPPTTFPASSIVIEALDRRCEYIQTQWIIRLRVQHLRISIEPCGLLWSTALSASYAEIPYQYTWTFWDQTHKLCRGSGNYSRHWANNRTENDFDPITPARSSSKTESLTNHLAIRR